MADGEFLTGRLLLAMPGMGDPRFERAAIAMCMHDETGAVGIGVGGVRRGVRFRDLLERVGIDPGAAPDADVLDGGPVEPQRGFVLHSAEWSGEGTVAVPPLGALTGSIDVLRAIAAGEGPRHWLFALGYAGWRGGQLEGEMRRHGWYAAAGHADVLFAREAPARWTAAWHAEGIDPALLANTTGRA